EDVRGLRHRVERAGLLCGDVDLELDVAETSGQVPAYELRELLPGHAQRLRRDVASIRVTLVDQPPLEAAGDHRRPRLAQLAALRAAIAVRPPVHVGQQRPLGQRLEAVEAIQWIAAEDQFDRGTEDL